MGFFWETTSGFIPVLSASWFGIDLPRSSSTWAVVCAGWFCSSRYATRSVPLDRRLVGVDVPGVMLDSSVQTVQRPVAAPQVQFLAGCGCAYRCATTGVRFIGAPAVQFEGRRLPFRAAVGALHGPALSEDHRVPQLQYVAWWSMPLFAGRLPCPSLCNDRPGWPR